MNNVESILGYPVAAVSLDACIQEILSWIESKERNRYVVCANPHSLEVAERDPDFVKAITGADMVIPDGIGIVIASRMMGGNIRERITGSDVFWEISKALDRRRGFSVFFLGSTEKNLEVIKDKMREDFPDIKVAGVFSPPFNDQFSKEENTAMIDVVNKAVPDVLWVGMTAPKQEKWIYANRDKLDVKFIGAIGAVFDFYSGNVKRSHPFFQKMGLEWLPRLLREPRRLWRRNLVSNPRFLQRVVKSRLFSRGETDRPPGEGSRRGTITLQRGKLPSAK